MKIISFAYSLSSSSAFRCNLQVQENHPHQVAGQLHAWQISHWISTHPYHKGQPLVEFPLTAVSLSKCPLCHLWPPLPTLSFYLHVLIEQLNLSTCPNQRRLFSQDYVEVINLKLANSLFNLIATYSGFILQIWLIMALSLRCKCCRSGFVKIQVSLA